MARKNRLNRMAARAAEGPVVVPREAVAVPMVGGGTADVVQLWAPTLARVTLGLVLLWFGVHELIQPSLWTGYVPVISQTSHLALGLVLFHGWVLSVLGVALVLGVMTRAAAAFSALLLLEIVLSLTFTGGLSDIVARDVGVFGLAAAVFAASEQRLALRG
ncbi:MAG TPA: hypothetical protein VNF75_00250 [Candidatus Dormibacteraeota bacterium]|nr:hypothetical protein [Candidatus Dormibacteraeota bacterium]